jgi:hypothetical protein
MLCYPLERDKGRGIIRKLFEKYRGVAEKRKKLGGNRFAYAVHIFAMRLCKLMNLRAPKIIIENEARALICYMALKDYADCK